ncbi:MAG: F0F1 ATP synthase subunit A [Bacilli bacterium]|nr:F0F1 ATP synthase subunit A [Bacilli bacterium]
MNISEILDNSSVKTVFNINIFNINIPITESIIMMWIISLILIFIALILSLKLKKVPGKRQGITESIIEFISNLCEDGIGEKGKKFVGFIGTILLFLVIANLIDILNVMIFNIDIIPPTKDLSVVIALSIISISSVIYAGIKYRKFSGFAKSFFSPVAIIFPFKVLDYLMKPVSLTLRLFGNISVGYLIMAIITSLVPLIIPSFLSLYFDIFDGLLQAYIFVFLTTLYIGEAVEE